MAWYDAVVDPVLEYGGAAVDAVGDFVTGGGGETAANAGEAMANAQLDSNSGFNIVDGFKTAAGYFGDGFDWLTDPDNAAAANLLGGAAMGAAEYYEAERARKQVVRENRKDRELERELANQKIQSQQIVPGSINNYGGYRDNITNGLISNGMIASRRGEEYGTR